jgi:transcriptional regulator with XRE-family HTH domain
MPLGERLRLLRNEKGLTMDMLVYDINSKFNIELNKGLISKWENGVNEPSLRYAIYLAQYYDVSLDYLIGLTDVKTPARLLAYASKQKQLEIPQLSQPNIVSKPKNRPRPRIPKVDDGDGDFEFEFLNMDD